MTSNTPTGAPSVNLPQLTSGAVSERSTSAKLVAAEMAERFMSELLDAVETLSGVAEQHGVRTLADLIYLQSAILKDGFVDHYPGESAVVEIIKELPSAQVWQKYIRSEYMLQSAAAPNEVDIQYPKVVVLCTDANGAPAFHMCSPECWPQQILNGDHYDMAKENAGFNGYGGPMMAFDSSDPAARQLQEILEWLQGAHADSQEQAEGQVSHHVRPQER